MAKWRRVTPLTPWLPAILPACAKNFYAPFQPKFDGVQQSVLNPLLPEAATFYLEHYGPEKYAEVFLGEFDNPEIIWNNEMR